MALHAMKRLLGKSKDLEEGTNLLTCTSDYTTWLHLQNNITSTAPQCDYKMVSVLTFGTTATNFSDQSN